MAKQTKAFTLVEILIVVLILGILAAVVVPQFHSTAKQAKSTALKDSLRSIRTQCELYRFEHAGRAPGYPSGGGNPTEALFKSQMLQFSSMNGVVSATMVAGYKGPYLISFPINPVNSLDTVNILNDSAEAPTEASGTYGWVYQPATLKFKADCTGADDDGISYFDY